MKIRLYSHMLAILLVTGSQLSFLSKKTKRVSYLNIISVDFKVERQVSLNLTSNRHYFILTTTKMGLLGRLAIKFQKLLKTENIGMKSPMFKWLTIGLVSIQRFDFLTLLELQKKTKVSASTEPKWFFYHNFVMFLCILLLLVKNLFVFKYLETYAFSVVKGKKYAAVEMDKV